MRVGFLQLPIPEHPAEYAGANRPLAAASMIAYARRHCTARGWEAEMAPEDLVNHGGDAALADWAANSRFNVLCLTLYLWNRERSLWLARTVKRLRPEILVLIGGPEVTEDQSLSDFPGADLACIGEGEAFFARFIDDAVSQNARGMRRAADLADLSQIPNPYLEGILPIRDGDTIHFEQMRGCPHRCAYCYYGKGTRGIRRFPGDRMPALFQQAAAHEKTEIYFMDPTFNIRKGLKRQLECTARSNRARVPIHTEVRLDWIDEAVADRMAAAGIQSVEAGLQSVNPHALKAVGRTWDRRSFLEGARLLSARGIDIRAGIIIGLPEDSLDDFLSTLDFLESAGLAASMEGFILSILPGTRLRRQFGRWGIKAMSRPPYWTMETGSMTPEDIIAAIQILERRGGIEYFPPVPPFSPAAASRFLTVLDLRVLNLDALPEDALSPARLANSVTLILDDAAAGNVRLARWAGFLLSAAPHTCWRIVVSGNVLWTPARWRHLQELFLIPDHYVNRTRAFRRDAQGAHSVRLFQVINNPDAARRFLASSGPAELAIRPGSEQMSGWEEVCRDTP